jgi:hypothetical protein
MSLKLRLLSFKLSSLLKHSTYIFLCCHDGAKSIVKARYLFIETLKEQLSVQSLCLWLGVSSRGDYAWGNASFPIEVLRMLNLRR